MGRLVERFSVQSVQITAFSCEMTMILAVYVVRPILERKANLANIKR